MPSPVNEASPEAVDLTAAASLGPAAETLLRAAVPASRIREVESLAEEDTTRARTRRLAETFRKLGVDETVEILKAAGKLSIRQETAGLRVLLGFLEVKRPGVEVLRQLRLLSSIERVSLRLVAGGWSEPQSSEATELVYPILEALQEAARIGAVDLGLDQLPRTAPALRALYGRVRGWFRSMEGELEAGRKLAPDALNFIAQLAMLEITLMEKRVSRLAGSVNPYDVRSMGRLMPILSRYDQDIEHMKSVVSRLTTYEPFYDRLLTLEHALSPSEMDKIQKLLLRDPVGAPLGGILQGMRANPILDREFVFLVSLVHQIAALRSQTMTGVPRPDVLSILHEVVRHGRGGTGIRLVMEEEIADRIWPTVQSWGVLRRSPSSMEVRYREDRALDFIRPDGTPNLPDRPEERKPPDLTLKELVRLQLGNEPFILGVLDNPKATAIPGLVPMIVNSTRSLRILDRIMRDRALYTGPANKEVPRLLLTCPARIPVNSLKRFIHVRFVSKMDLARLSRQGGDIRSEVKREIDKYLATLRK
jgi:hypothetical protein